MQKNKQSLQLEAREKKRKYMNVLFANLTEASTTVTWTEEEVQISNIEKGNAKEFNDKSKPRIWHLYHTQSREKIPMNEINLDWVGRWQNIKYLYFIFFFEKHSQGKIWKEAWQPNDISIFADSNHVLYE